MREETRNTRDGSIKISRDDKGRITREVYYSRDGQMQRGKMLGYGEYRGILPIFVRHFGSDGVYTSGSRFKRDLFGRPAVEEKFRYDLKIEDGKWVKRQELRNKWHGSQLTHRETIEYPSKKSEKEQYVVREEQCQIEHGFTEEEMIDFDEAQRVAQSNEHLRRLEGFVARGKNRSAAYYSRKEELRNMRPLDGIYEPGPAETREIEVNSEELEPSNPEK